MDCNMAKPQFEMGDVARLYGKEHRLKYFLTRAQHLALNHIRDCGTEKLGGLVYNCESCHYETILYNHCRDRHCPTCQSMASAQWLADRKSELLPVGYFHLVFKLPEALVPVAYQNQRCVYNIMFRAASKALEHVGKDRQYLGAEIGAQMMLHTWAESMYYQPHIHVLLPAGGISADGSKWINFKTGSTLPTDVLSSEYRRL